MIRRLDRYIIRETMTPLFMTLGIAALLLLLERMLRLFDFVVNQGGPVEVVFQLLLNLIPHYMGLALPIGLFIGILVAYRKLSMSSELDAMQANGMGLSRLVRPVLMLSFVAMLVNIILIGYIQPHSRYNYYSLVFDLRSGALGASVKVGEFVDLGDNMVLRVDESRDNGTELYGIFLERTQRFGKKIAVTAESGGFFATSDRQNVVLRLQNGKLVDFEENSNKPRVLTFESQDIVIDLPAFSEFRARGQVQLELTFDELWTTLQTMEPNNRDYNEIRGAFHWRVMSVLTFLMLPFLAVPLGITNKRSPTSVGMVVGLSLLILYNELMEVAQRSVFAGNSPYTSIWALFTLYLIVSFSLFYVRAFKVGADPLGFLNKSFNKIKDALLWLIKPWMKGWE